MQPVVALPDAEMVVLDYLRPRLTPTWPTVKVGTIVPGSRPFVQVRRIGGSSEMPGVDEPRVDLVIYHDTDHNRMQLALACWALLKAAASDRVNSGVITYTATTMGPRQMPDPADPTKRVAMLTVDLLMRLGADGTMPPPAGGAAVLTGHGPPSPDLASDGVEYVDLDTGDVYGSG